MQETRIIDPAQTYEAQSVALPTGAELLGGKFKIEEQIGSGGFGITYLAQDIYLDRSVVIKECFPEAFCFRVGATVQVSSPRFEAQHRKTVEMFMLEARSIGKLRHPNIVGVHQVFEENDTAYMVLDLINGRDLLDIIEDDNELFSPDLIRDILVKCLDAMDLVHRNDLLHRDISPDNILVDKWGTPVLIDFGAAREEASKRDKQASTMLVVKDGYSPHEFYISGGLQGPFSDLYALGATMYHLISGDPPPISQSRVAGLTENDYDPYVPLLGRFPQYETSFLESIDRALQVAPKHRMQSAREWLETIETETQKVKKVKIPEGKVFHKTISELVTETNKHVLTSPVEPLAPKPAEAPTTRRATDKPFNQKWIEEFNRETEEVALKKEEEARAAAHKARLEEHAKAQEEKLLAERAMLLEQRARETLRLEEGEAQKSRGLLNWVPRPRSD